MQTLVTLDKWAGSLKLINLDTILWCDTFSDKLSILDFCMVVFFGIKVNHDIGTNK